MGWRKIILQNLAREFWTNGTIQSSDFAASNMHLSGFIFVLICVKEMSIANLKMRTETHR